MNNGDTVNFEDILNYLDLLVGRELHPINPSTESITITTVDRDKKRYYLTTEKTSKETSRLFKELQIIWEELTTKGFVNVDQALSGSGTSRHQPETLLANIPNIEHFKYARKKHLYLRDNNTHTPGTLKELSHSEAKNIKKKIESFNNFEISSFHNEHSKLLIDLKSNLSSVFKKYPGESDVDNINQILSNLDELDIKLPEAVVNIDINKDDISLAEEDEDEDEDEDTNKPNTEIVSDEHNTTDDYYDSSNGLKKSRISQVNPTISLLYDRVNFGEIELQPEFQRKDRIWTDENKSRLIESLLLGLPLPVFYFAERRDEDWIIIDGLQRLTTLVDFMAGDFPLEKLERLDKHNNKFFSNLDRKDQRAIREYQIQGHLIQISNDRDDMVRELFQRINTYGKKLSPQEIRSALYPGSATRFLRYLAEGDVFLNSTDRKIPSGRMQDMEFLLHATSFIVQGYSKYKYQKMDSFLCKTLSILNEYEFNLDGKICINAPLPSINASSNKIFILLKSKIEVSLELASIIFEDRPYRKKLTEKINKSLFEVIISVFSIMSTENIEFIKTPHIANKIRNNFYEMITKDSQEYAEWISPSFEAQNRGFDYSISNSTGKKVTIDYRFNSIISMLNSLLKSNSMNTIEFKGILEDINK